MLRKRQQTPNLEIGRLDNVTLKAIVMYVHVTYPAAQLPWPEPPCAVHSLDVRHVPFRNAVELKFENKFSATTATRNPGWLHDFTYPLERLLVVWHGSLAKVTTEKRENTEIQNEFINTSH